MKYISLLGANLGGKGAWIPCMENPNPSDGALLDSMCLGFACRLPWSAPTWATWPARAPSIGSGSRLLRRRCSAREIWRRPEATPPSPRSWTGTKGGSQRASQGWVGMELFFNITGIGVVNKYKFLYQTLLPHYSLWSVFWGHSSSSFQVPGFCLASSATNAAASRTQLFLVVSGRLGLSTGRVTYTHIFTYALLYPNMIGKSFRFKKYFDHHNFPQRNLWFFIHR